MFRDKLGQSNKFVKTYFHSHTVDIDSFRHNPDQTEVRCAVEVKNFEHILVDIAKELQLENLAVLMERVVGQNYIHMCKVLGNSSCQLR